jgi:hypothetical protein
MKPGFHCVRTHWIRGFISFQPATPHVKANKSDIMRKLIEEGGFPGKGISNTQFRITTPYRA